MRFAMSASSPKVPLARAHRGSVAKSACGASDSRMPTDSYSWRSTSAKRQVSSGSLNAAKPRGSGHMENALSCVLAPSICSKWYRGSEEMITGTQPRGLRNRLYLVVLFGEELSASIQPGNESVDMIFIDELAHFHPVVL